MCALIDEPVSLVEANAVSEFFCHIVNTEFSGAALRFAFSFSKDFMRIILSGEKDAVQEVLARYHERK